MRFVFGRRVSMQVIYYTDDDHLRQILRARTDAAMPAAVLLPRGWEWLLNQGHGKVCATENYGSSCGRCD